jgi:pilus assembly protein CpaF
MRPDRIIVGEVRGPEAFDMLQAMNTGHEGSLTTIHANTPRDGLARIENMIGMADLNLPITAIRRQIASAIHLVIQIMRMEDGSRRLVKLSEIVGMESDTVVMQDIFIFKQSGVDEKGIIQGQHIWTGIFPKHQELNRALREAGMMTIVAGTR